MSESSQKRVLTKLQKKLLHYTGKAIADYHMIGADDRVLVCVSGGKDSLVLTSLLHTLELRTNHKFSMHVFILDNNFPGFEPEPILQWLENSNIPYTLQKENIYAILQQKAKDNSYCMLCSRFRRGIIYSYAKKHGFNKIALGHHRDDLIISLLMSILYKGEIGSMPPKLLSNDKQNIVIRPLCYCQEQDIKKYADINNFPILRKNLCKAKENPTRQAVKALINNLAEANPKVPSNVLHALQRVRPSQLMDRELWRFE